MACELNDDAVKFVYGYVYGEISDRVSGKNKNPLDIKTMMKEFYNELNSLPNEGFKSEEDKREKALYFAQSIPQIMGLVAARPKARDYILKTNTQLFIDIPTFASEYSDIKKVQALVKPRVKTIKVVKKEIQADLEELPVPMPDESKKYSYAEYSARIVYPNGTSGQEAIPVDPGSDEEKNKKDPEKKMFYDVIKDIVYIIRKNPDGEVLYGVDEPVSLALTMMPVKNADPTMFTSKDKTEQETYGARGIVAVVTDTEGAEVYFNEDGSINRDGGGRRVYQFVRKPIVENGKLFFGGAYGKKTSLVPAEEVAQTWLKQKREQNIYPSEKEVAAKTIEIRNKQTKLFNDLFRLREFIEDTEQRVTVKITNGSFGLVNDSNKFVPISETGLTAKDLNFQLLTTGDYPGRYGATITKSRPGVTVDQLLLAQRSNMSDELAGHIADVLTTTAVYRGKQLTPEQRRIFFENFIDNKPTKGYTTNYNKIIAKEKADPETGRKILEVSINGQEPIPQNILYTEKGRKLIYDHLKTAQTNWDLYAKQKGAQKVTYSAVINLNDSLWGKQYTDFIIDKETNKFFPEEEDYFDFIKDKLLIQYPTETDAYFSGMNAYLNFAIPQNIVPTDVQVFEVGEPAPKKDKEPAQKSSSTEPKAKVKNLTNYQAAKDFYNKGNGTWGMRPAKGLFPMVPFDQHVGNPWSTQKDALNKNVKIVKDLATATKNYEDWLTGKKHKTVEPKRRKWILDAIQKGWFNDATFVYYKPAGSNYRSHIDVLVDLVNKRNKVTDADIVIKEPITKPAPAPKKQSMEVKATVSSILNNPNRKSYLKRDVKLNNFFENIFTTKSARDKALGWWEGSFLSQVKVNGQAPISLERLTEIANSDAVATFDKSGITLYKGSSNIDIYHEAWHAFSQLFLTPEEQVSLYNSVKEVSKWKNADYFDIEEDIAEDFRSYMKSEKFKESLPSFIRGIFERIGAFLRWAYGKISRQDMTRPRDIPRVREMFDVLRTNKPEEAIKKGLFQSLNATTQNMSFTKLNRGVRNIQPLKANKNINEFTAEESMQIVNAMDSLAALEFQDYNLQWGNTAGYIRISQNAQNRIGMYENMLDIFYNGLTQSAERLEELTLKNIDAEEITPEDAAEEIRLTNLVELFGKIVDNFGDIRLSLDKKQNTGIVAYHMKKSRFTMLKESYNEVEDTTSIDALKVMKDASGNVLSSKEVASEETLMLLSGLFTPQKQNGKVVRDENGMIIYKTDMFGIPQLEPVNNVWNKLAKILEGSYDINEMYQRILDNMENYPELEQLMNLLPQLYHTDIDAGGYKIDTEFKTETNFWQDLKKPRIRYIQLNIDKEGDDKFTAKMSKASMDVYKVTGDWESNFILGNPSINPYMEKEIGTDNNILKINPDTGDLTIVEKFGKKAIFSPEESIEFLKGLGIELDMSSSAIRNIVNDKKLNFGIEYGLNIMMEALKSVNNSTDEYLKDEFRRNPLKMLSEGLPVGLRKDKNKSLDVQSRVRMLAEIQNEFSDGFSNFSVLNAERNRVWEHFVDNTITRTITSINKAETYQELTQSPYFKHMHWLAKSNNTLAPFSQLLNSVFYMKFNPRKPEQYGTKRKDAKLILQNITGTQFISKNVDDTTGSNTASMDAVGKFLQEYHTMLLQGVEEFMRHASKNMAMGITVDRDTSIITSPGKKNKKLYIDIDAFEPGRDGELQGAEIMIGYLSGEANRIFRFKSDLDKFENYAGYNREVVDKLGRTVMAGEAFTLFDDILTKKTQEDLYDIIESAVNDEQFEFNMSDILDENIELRNKVESDIIQFFNLMTEENFDRLDENNYVDSNLINEYRKEGVIESKKDITQMLTKAYSYNSYIHKYETVILAYGDLVQYNHAKEEFHKRNAGLGSGGKGFRADLLAQKFINSDLSKEYIDYLNLSRGAKNQITPRNYDGTFKTAIMKEYKLDSVYYDEYLEDLTKTYTERYGDKTKAKKLAEKVLKEYKGMKVADGQGYVTFEAYRNLKWLEGNWSNEQEALYNKVSRGENVTLEDAIQYFPPYKLQYFGNIESTGLPVNSFHKFSLAPLVPGLAKPGTELYDLHIKMMEEQIDYVTFETGSKVSHIGKGDKVFNEDGTFNQDVKFNTNTIYAEFLKNQTEINSSYKGVSIFSTQLRKMILEGLYEKGEIKSKDKEFVKGRADDYLKKVEFLTNIHKLQLLNEIGYEEINGEFVPTSSASIEKLANMIRTNLEKDEVLSDDLIDFIDVYEKDNTLVNDLSFHPESAKIEKLLLSIINKKVIKQKVKGEALVQVSSAFFNNYASTPANYDKKSPSEIDAIVKKYAGTNFLPTYHKKADGFTAAMKVMISMQGDYLKLLNLEYANNETIGLYREDGTLDMDGSLERLNEKIKDDEWLDADNGANRKAITMVGVRIPVQGLNSMEFMEVYHFLPPQAGNIIVPPAEIVAKSGADFDIDKLTIFMSNLSEEGKVKKPEYNTYNDFKAQYDLMKSTDMSAGQMEMFFEQQKAGVENELIESMKGILELPDNYSSLITPNSNYILEPIAADLAKYVMNYDPFANKMTEANVTPDGKKTISPTRVLESLYNVYKHESNIVGKRTLGLGAIENTFNVVFNSLGAYMPNVYTHTVGKKVQEREAHLYLRHHKMNVKGEEHISISNMFDVDNEYKVADVLAQMINGWVDVEKDPWIFFIQGNYETAPILLYLLKTGVPVEEAIYFVSNPLTIEYIKEKNLGQSTFAEVLDKKPEYKAKLAEEAAGRVIRKYFYPTELKMNTDQFKRYDKGVELANKYLEEREDKHFTKDEMYKLIKNFKENDGKLKEKEASLAKAMFLHFLEIEQQITGLTALKLSSNPDTSTKSTGSEVELSEAGIEQLADESKITSELRTKMLNDSIISSFFNGPMALAIIRPLFKLKYNKYISNYIVENAQMFRNSSSKLLGERKVDTFITMFRNDLISMIFQNAIRKYKMDDTYMSYSIKKEIPIALASDIKSRGAFVKANKDGTKFMYIDEQSLKEEFKSGAWEIGSEEDNSYESRGMYPLDPRTFLQNGKVNFDLYMKFVAEREFLRSEYPIEDMMKKSWFRKEGGDIYDANPDVDSARLGRYVYERYITNKALDNVYNFYHLFIDKDNSLGSRYSKFLIEHKNSLLQDYSLLNVMKLDTNKNKSIFNIYLADKDINTDLANIYTMNLKNLSDRSVLKITDKDENDRISDMFALMSNFAFLQTGLNKSKLSYTNIADFTSFLDIMKSESDVFTKALEENAGPILDQFFKQFTEQNSRRNIDKGRFKDYLNDMDFEKAKSIEATQPSAAVEVKEGVQEIFNSNPELAQIGTKEQYSQYLDTIFLDSNMREIVYRADRRTNLDEKTTVNDKTLVYPTGVFYTTNLGYAKTLNKELKGKIYPSLLNIKAAASVDKQDIQYFGRNKDAFDKEFPKEVDSLVYFPDREFSDPADEDIYGDVGTEFVVFKPKQIHILGGKKDIEGFKKFVNQPSTQRNFEDTPYELEETARTNVFQYQDKLGDKEFYKNLVNNNTDVVFIRNNVNETYKNPNKNFKGQQELDKFADNMTMNITTSLTKQGDNFANLPKEAYKDVIRLWEEEIAHISNINDGVAKLTKIAFPTSGFGDPALMPQELFVYLSKRLFDEFGYINPGSVMYNEMQFRNAVAEGITDDEILDQLGLEEDPFKCE